MQSQHLEFFLFSLISINRKYDIQAFIIPVADMHNNLKQSILFIVAVITHKQCGCQTDRLRLK